MAGRSALKGGSPQHKKRWPKWPLFSNAEERTLLRVLRSGVWGLGGTANDEFAGQFAEYQGAKYGVTCSNGTVALEVALRSLGIGYGDEVITSAYTFMATAQSVLYVNARPIFVDIEADTYNLDPSKIEEAITDRTRAIMPVHIGGAPTNMDEIMRIAKKNGLRVVEDSAQAHGAKWGERGAGAIGDYGTFSFQSSKNINCGEGGAILTNDEELAQLAWSYMNCGRIKAGRRYEHRVLGSNFRLGEFQAAILLAQLPRAKRLFEKRERNARYLDERLSEIEGIGPLRYPTKARSAYHLYIFRYRKEHFGNLARDKFLEALRAEGIPASPGYVPLYRENAFLNFRLPCDDNGFGEYCRNLQLPVTEKACSEEGIWLGQTTLLASRSEMDDIADAIVKVQDNLSELL